MRPVAEKTMFAGFKPTTRARKSRRHLVAVVAFDGVVLSDLATACDVFGRARDSKGSLAYDVRVCSLRRHIRSEHLKLDAPWRLASLKQANTVIVPGIDPIDRPVPEELVRALRRAIRRGARVASICTGAFVLARTGALRGLKATTHWRAAAELARLYPEIDVNPGVLYVDNGQILTSAGAAAGLDLCLHLVRRDLGADIAARTARMAVMPLERAGGQAQFIVHQPPSVNGHAGMVPLLTWMEQNLDKQLSLPVIARHAAMSIRTLSRRFLEQVGTTPAQWVTTARVRRAQRLLETTGLSVEEVAAESGFRSASVLRDHFGAIVGTAPLVYRQSFAGNTEARHKT
jgi:transcriptional regulator GlxA family with amidase domain